MDIDDAAVSISLVELNRSPGPEHAPLKRPVGKENAATVPSRSDDIASSKKKRESVGPRRRSTRFCRAATAAKNSCHIPSPTLPSVPTQKKRRQTATRAPIQVEDKRQDVPIASMATVDKPSDCPEERKPTDVRVEAVQESAPSDHELPSSGICVRVTRSASRKKTRSASLNTSTPMIGSSSNGSSSSDLMNTTIAAPIEAEELVNPGDVTVTSESTASPGELNEEQRRARAQRRRSRVFSHDPEEDRILSLLGRRPLTTDNVRAAFLEAKRNSPRSPDTSRGSLECGDEVQVPEEPPEASADTDAEIPNLRRSKRAVTKPDTGGTDASPKKPRNRKGRSRKSSTVTSTDIIDDETVLKFIYDPETAKKEYVVSAGKPLETVYELNESDSDIPAEESKVFSKKKEPRLMVFPTNPEDNCRRKRKARKEKVKKAGFKLMKGVGAIFDRAGKLDPKKLESISEEMKKLL